MGRTVACASVVFAVLAGPLWAEDKAVLARQTRDVLTAHCHRCHGENGTVEGGLNYLLDRERLVARKKVVPGDPAASRLLQRVQAGEMPPPDAKNRPNKEELATLSEWIKAGAPLLQPAEKRPPLSYAAVLDLIDKDLAALPQEDRAFTRYLTLTHFYNAGASADELETYRQALSKLVNSLSWASRIVVPTAVDPARTVYRIDLRKYQLTPRSWTLLTVRYRYHHNTNSAVETRIKEAIGQSPPFVRADWAAVHATEPRLYPRLLELPESFEQFEKRLRVSVDDNLRTGEVIRAGFRHSAVVDTPRLVERHETPFGALWLTTDGSRLRNLFTASATPPLRAAKGDDHLAHFHLPNGLLAYAIYRSGLKKVETIANGVHDRRTPERQVTLGLSCLSCHSRGVLAGADQVRGHFEKLAARLTAEQLEQVRTLFPPRATFQMAATDDARRYREAVEKTGGRPGGTDPILVLALRHEEEVDLKRAAVELEQSPEELARKLAQVRDQTPGLEPLRKGDSVRRLDFVHAYRKLLPRQPFESFVEHAPPVGPRPELLLPVHSRSRPRLHSEAPR